MLLCSSAACFCSLTCFNVFTLNIAISVPHIRTLPKSPFPVSKCPFLCHFVHLWVSFCPPFCPLRPLPLPSPPLRGAGGLPLPSCPVFVLFERDSLSPPSFPDFSRKTPLPLAYVKKNEYLCRRNFYLRKNEIVCLKRETKILLSKIPLPGSLNP